MTISLLGEFVLKSQVSLGKMSLMKKFKINLISLKTKNLKKKQILSICKLKNSFWRWTIPNQLEWYKKNVKKTDINNMLILDNKLVGYTLLRKRIAYVKNKPLIYYYFDTFVLSRKIRYKSFGKTFIQFNNEILNKLKKHSFLTCTKKTISFYLKNDWKILPKNKFKIMDHKHTWFNKKTSVNGMTYNLDRKIKRKIFYYFN
jgi:hypothetical protein